MRDVVLLLRWFDRETVEGMPVPSASVAVTVGDFGIST